MAANYMTNTIGYDTSFELNEFNEPRLRSEIEVVKDVLIFVLTSKPGQYPSLPMIGLDIQQQLYSFYDDINVSELQDKIISQCEMLGLYFKQGAIQIKKLRYRGKGSIMIHIEGSEVYPDGYKKDSINNAERYLIGLTLDDLNRLIYNINEEGGV